MFLIQQRWNPEVFWVEDGTIWKSISPMIYKEMQKRGIFINCQPRLPIKDKATRGRAYQKRMRAGGCKYDMEQEWFPGFQDEILRFTGYGESAKDDQFDSAALLALGFEDLHEMSEEDFLSDEEEMMQYNDPRKLRGRNEVTGY